MKRYLKAMPCYSAGGSLPIYRDAGGTRFSLDAGQITPTAYCDQLPVRSDLGGKYVEVDDERVIAALAPILA